MDDRELQNIWKAYDRKLEEAKLLNLQSWALNIKSFEILQTQKAKSKLNSLARFKTWAIFAGILWIAILVFLIYHSLSFQKIFFVVSTSFIALFTLIAVIVYIQHVVWIRQIDNSETVIDVQEKIAKLQASTLNIVRILFLQMPFYTTWWFTPQMILGGDSKFWVITFPITLLFVFFSIWLYRNINYKNADKKWFRVLFNSPEWTSVTKAIDFIKEIEEYKSDRS